MAEILSPQVRTGLVATDLLAPVGQTQIEIGVPFAAVDLGVAPIGIRVLIEQSIDGVTWWTLAGGATFDLRDYAETLDKRGLPRTRYWVRGTEQIVRHDVFSQFKWDAAYELKNDADGAWYHQLAIAPKVRISVDLFKSDPAAWHDLSKSEADRWANARLDNASLSYGLTFDIRKTAQPPTPIGRRSASLIGTFASGEAGGTSATSGNRTSTSGSFIVGQGGTFDAASTHTNSIADNKSNAFTEHFEITCGAFAAGAMASNNAGTRGATHNLTNTASAGSDGTTCGGLEFSGVAASPTTDVGTGASGTSSAPSCSVTPSGGAALVVGHVIYDGASTTFAVNVGTEGLEVDENNTEQANATNYRVAQSAASTTSWTLGASRDWAARSVAWTEDAGGGGGRTTKNTRAFPLGIEIGMDWRS